MSLRSVLQSAALAAHCNTQATRVKERSNVKERSECHPVVYCRVTCYALQHPVSLCNTLEHTASVACVVCV